MTPRNVLRVAVVATTLAVSCQVYDSALLVDGTGGAGTAGSDDRGVTGSSAAGAQVRAGAAGLAENGGQGNAAGEVGMAGQGGTVSSGIGGTPGTASAGGDATGGTAEGGHAGAGGAATSGAGGSASSAGSAGSSGRGAGGSAGSSSSSAGSAGSNAGAASSAGGHLGGAGSAGAGSAGAGMGGSIGLAGSAGLGGGGVAGSAGAGGNVGVAGSAGVGGSGGVAGSAGAGGGVAIASGCANLSVPLAAVTHKARFVITLTNKQNLSNATISMRFYVKAGVGGVIANYVQDSNFNLLRSATPAKLNASSGWQTLSWKIADQGTGATGMVLSDTFRVGIEVNAAPDASWSNPTLVYVDSITVSSPSLSFAFDSSSTISPTPTKNDAPGQALWPNAYTEDTTTSNVTLGWLATCP